MRRWKPIAQLSRWIAPALLLFTWVALALPIVQIAQAFRGSAINWQINIQLFGWVCLLWVLLALATWLAYRTASAFTLAYELDRNGLYITWLGNRAIVPLDQIASLDIGIDLERLPLGVLQHLGSFWGRAFAAQKHPVRLFSTLNPTKALVVHTAAESYVISPSDPESFIQDLEQRRNLGSTKPLSLLIEPGRAFLYSFWNDPIIRWLLFTAILVNMIGLALLSARYPQLAATLNMRFDPVGQVADVRPRYQILFIPLAAFGLTLVNLILGMVLYARQLLSARLIQGASLVVQILFAIALVTITR